MLEKYLLYFDIEEGNYDDYLSQGKLMWGMAKLNHEDLALKNEIENVLNQKSVRLLDLANFHFILNEGHLREVIGDSIV